jgi:hypothetical protein
VTDIPSSKMEQNGVATRIFTNFSDDLHLGPRSRRRPRNPACHPGGPQSVLGQSDQRAPDDNDHRVSLHGGRNQKAGRWTLPAWTSD